MSVFFLILFTLQKLTISVHEVLKEFPTEVYTNFYNDVKARIDTFKRQDTIETKTLLPTSIRLIFHDCAGENWCNGCINPNNPEHNGLEYGAIFPMEQVFKNSIQVTFNDLDNTPIIYSTASVTQDTWNGNPSNTDWSNFVFDEVTYKISRADFWILFAQASLEYGVELAYLANPQFGVSQYSYACNDVNGNGVNFLTGNGIECVDMILAYGRPDCSTSPYVVESGDKFKTDTEWTWNELITFFKQKFNLKPVHVVGLMGVHTLGQAHPVKDRSVTNPNNCCGGSGFRGKWKDNISTFTNEYYQFMKDKDWIVRKSNTKRSSSDTIYNNFNDNTNQFTFVNPNAQTGDSLTNLMLNIDMELFINIDASHSCAHPNIYSKFQSNTATSQYIINSIDNKQQCIRNAQARGEKKFDVYEIDNINWLYDFINAWEFMVFNGYDFHTGTIYHTRTPTTPFPTSIPTKKPTTKMTTNMPSINPTTNNPSKIPTNIPSINPTPKPTQHPSKPGDTGFPSISPTIKPTYYPTINPTKNPIFNGQQTNTPTNLPTLIQTQTTQMINNPKNPKFSFSNLLTPSNYSIIEYSIIFGIVLIIILIIICIICIVYQKKKKEKRRSSLPIAQHLTITNATKHPIQAVEPQISADDYYGNTHYEEVGMTNL